MEVVETMVGVGTVAGGAASGSNIRWVGWGEWGVWARTERMSGLSPAYVAIVAGRIIPHAKSGDEPRRLVPADSFGALNYDSPSHDGSVSGKLVS